MLPSFLAGVKSELAHGTPSEINTYISMNNCTKFGALIRSVTIQSLSHPTKVGIVSLIIMFITLLNCLVYGNEIMK